MKIKNTFFLAICCIFSFSFPTNGQIAEQFFHAKLTENGASRMIQLLGASSVSSTSNTNLSNAFVNCTNSNDEWVYLKTISPNENFIVDFLIYPDLQNEVFIQTTNSPATAIKFFSNFVAYLYEGVEIMSEPYDSDDVFRIMNCNGRLYFAKNSENRMDKLSNFGNGSSLVVKTISADGTEIFCHIKELAECVDDNIQYIVPQRKTSSHVYSIHHDELGLHYIEKYAIRSNDLYDNQNVHVEIFDVSSVPVSELPWSASNAYGANYHLIDISSLTTNKVYQAKVTGINKGDTYTFNFRKVEE